MGIRFTYFVRYRGLFYKKAKIKFLLMMSGAVVNLYLALLFLLLNLLFDHNLFTLFFYVNLLATINSLLPHQMSDGYYACLILFNKNNIRFRAIKNLFLRDKTKDAAVNILSLVYAGLLILDAVIRINVFISLLSFLPERFGVNQQIYNGVIIGSVILLKCIFLFSAYKKANKPSGEMSKVKKVTF